MQKILTSEMSIKVCIFNKLSKKVSNLNCCNFKTISARTPKFWILANPTKGSHHTDLFKNLRDDSNQFLEVWLRSLGMTQ